MPGTKWCGECWSSTHSPGSACWQRLKFAAILHQSSMIKWPITSIIDIEYRPGHQPRGNNGAGVRLRFVGQWVFLWQACTQDHSTHYDANDYNCNTITIIITFFSLTGTQDPSTQSSTSTGLCIYKDKITILLTKKFISQDWKTPHEWGDVHSFVQATFSSVTFSFISSCYPYSHFSLRTRQILRPPPYPLSRKSCCQKTS